MGNSFIRRVHVAMPEIVEEFFCSGLDEEERGKQLYIKIIFLILSKCPMYKAGE